MRSAPLGSVDPWLARRGGSAAATAGLAVGGAALGFALVAISARAGSAGPAVLVGVALAPIVATMVVAYSALALVVVFATFPVGSTDLPGGVLKIVQGAALAMAALIILRRLAAGRTPLPWAPPLWWAVALLGWSLVGLASALDTQLAIKQIGALLGGVVFALLVLAACKNMADLRRILLAFVVIAGGTAAYALANAGNLRTSFGGAIIEGRLTGTFVHPNELGSFCAMGSLVAAGLALGGRSRGARILATGSMCVLLAGLTLSFARGAWIGLALGLVFLLAVLREARRAALVIGIPFIVFAALVGSFSNAGKTQISVVSERIGALTTTSPYDNRREIWREAIREIRDDPLTGQGPGNFPVASVRAASAVSTVYAEHAHNLALTWTAEAGLPALVLIAGLAVALAAAGHQAASAAVALGRRRDRALVAGLAAALVSVLGQGLVDYTLRNAVIFLTVWALVGALLVARRELVAAVEAVGGEPPDVPVEPSGYDAPLARQSVEERERRLVAQSEALYRRRERLDRLRVRLEAWEAALDARAGTLADSPPAEAQLDQRELDALSAELEEHQRLIVVALAEAEEATRGLEELTGRASTSAEREKELLARRRRVDERTRRQQARAVEHRGARPLERAEQDLVPPEAQFEDLERREHAIAVTAQELQQQGALLVDQAGDLAARQKTLVDRTLDRRDPAD